MTRIRNGGSKRNLKLYKDSNRTIKPRLTHYLVAAPPGLAFTLGLHAEPTPLTYQGQLTENGVPTTGLYDLRFELVNSETSGGSPGAVANLNIGITNGLITVTLDFGPGAFDGAKRWLETGVTTSGAGAPTIFASRLRVTGGFLGVAVGGTADQRTNSFDQSGRARPRDNYLRFSNTKNLFRNQSQAWAPPVWTNAPLAAAPIPRRFRPRYFVRSIALTNPSTKLRT